MKLDKKSCLSLLRLHSANSFLAYSELNINHLREAKIYFDENIEIRKILRERGHVVDPTNPTCVKCGAVNGEIK